MATSAKSHGFADSPGGGKQGLELQGLELQGLELQVGEPGHDRERPGTRWRT
jgi:hypothetical protein